MRRLHDKGRQVKYLYRVEYNGQNLWLVSIGAGYTWHVSKRFLDKNYPDKYASRLAALLWRNEQLERLKPQLDKHMSKGWNEYYKANGIYEYLYIAGSVTKNKQRRTKTVSVNKYGYEEAVKKILEWREYTINNFK